MKNNLHLIKKYMRGLAMMIALFSLTISYAQEGLQLHYDFSTVSGTTVPDLSGNGYDGELLGSATVSVLDDKNTLYLPGTDAYLEIPVSTGVDQMLGGLTDCSILCWVNAEQLLGWSRVWDFGSGTAWNMFLSPSHSSDNNVPRFALKGDGSTEQHINTSTALNTNEWYHIAIILEGNVGKMYINGALAGENTNFTYDPASMGPSNFTQNWIGRSQWPDPYYVGSVADFRIYNRALAAVELLNFLGYPTDLINSYGSLDLGDLSNITADVSLPATGDGAVTISWASSDSATIHPDGTVNRPESFDRVVSLTATLSEYVAAEDSTYSLTKSFSATVKALVPANELLARWVFEDEDIDFSNPDSVAVTDKQSGWVGKLRNASFIRTIGTSFPYNVLDLGGDGAPTSGDAGGYFDMGLEIGEAMYDLSNYTIGCFFRVDDDYAFEGFGHFLYTFCNTEDIYDGGGAIYMLPRPGNVTHIITPSDYTVDAQTGGSTDLTLGSWHHIAFVQNGTTGSIYLDGQLVGQNTTMPTPATTIARDTLNGTPFNWIGRSPYPSDNFLENTQVYDFRLYSVPLSQDDLNADYGFDINFVLEDLELAWAEDSNAGFPEELNDEWAALTLGDLSALTGGTDLDLPIVGNLDNTIGINWSSSNTGLISTDGMVTAPKYLDTDVTLTAELVKRGYRLYKEFSATVLADQATKYNSDLLISYNFAPELRSGATITDASEKAFTGTLMNSAAAGEISDGVNEYSVLDLNDSTDYFDMGQGVGEVIYNIGNEFSISAFFLIKDSKTNLTDNGNFIWAFSNSDSSDIDRDGYMFGRATNAVYSITPEYWATPPQQGTFGIAAPPSLGEWHNMTYVQNDTLGITYFDGEAVDTATITNYPNAVLPKEGLAGTMYNWLGRPNFSADTWINPAMIYDFKVYSRAMTPQEVATVYDEDLVNGLNLAYLLTPVIVGVEDVKTNSALNIDTSIPGLIRINGLKGNEAVNVYDLVGRSVEFTNSRAISVKSGIYIVKVNDNVKKVFVK